MVVAPRKRTFDPTTTLDAAMELFWAHGYHNCSIADVVAASGVARYGVYQEFGDKNALYRAALQRYRELAAANLKTQLKKTQDLNVFNLFKRRLFLLRCKRIQTSAAKTVYANLFISALERSLFVARSRRSRGV